MKILSITTQKPHSTGSGTYLTELVSAFNRAGCKQAVVAGIYHSDVTSFPDDVEFYPVYYSSYGEEADISYKILGMSDIMPYPSTRYRELSRDMTDELEHAFMPVIRNAVRKLDPDIILCHHLFLLTAMVSYAFPEKYVIGLSHGSDIRQMQSCLNHVEGYDPKGHMAEYIMRGISSLNCVLALHEEQKSQISKLYGINKKNIMTIGSGYNPKIFYPPVKPKREPVQTVIFAGKLSKEKGILPMLHALNKIAENKEYEFNLYLAGGCNDHDVATALGAGSLRDLRPGIINTRIHIREIKYLGMLTQEALADAFRNADVFVLPSFHEGLPLVLIEAMSSGLIPVCTDLPGIKDWIDATIPDNNIIYVDMPPLRDVGFPDEKNMKKFATELTNAIKTALDKAKELKHIPYNERTPDTSGASWDAVAAHITSLTGDKSALN